MTLEEYFRTEYADGKIDHWLRAHITDTGEVHIYIHPANRDGNTTPMLVVSGNTVAEKQWP